MNKLKNKNGETMVEALIACLIIALAITMLSNVMSSAARVVQKDREVQKKQSELMQQFWNGNGNSMSSFHVNLDFGNGISIDNAEVLKTTVVSNGSTTDIYEFKTK